MLFRSAPGGDLTPSVSAFLTGPASPRSVDPYSSISGPTNFGSGGETPANSGSGDLVGISRTMLVVPHLYVSGNALSDTSTWNNATFASLGVTPGTYVWTWGPGPDQKFTLEIKFPTPTNISQCKNNGWGTLTRADGTRFENQGECIRYVNTGR